MLIILSRTFFNGITPCSSIFCHTVALRIHTLLIRHCTLFSHSFSLFLFLSLAQAFTSRTHKHIIAVLIFKVFIYNQFTQPSDNCEIYLRTYLPLFLFFLRERSVSVPAESLLSGAFTQNSSLVSWRRLVCGKLACPLTPPTTTERSSAESIYRRSDDNHKYVSIDITRAVFNVKCMCGISRSRFIKNTVFISLSVHIKLYFYIYNAF